MTYYITNSGRKIDIATISLSDICIKDIAHHLTKICRYGGALDLNKHYSVANHSLALYYYARDNGYSLDVQKAVLLHDAAEAYLGDIVAGLKKHLPDYSAIEITVEHLIAEKYQLNTDKEVADIVKELDSRIILDEAIAFMPYYYYALFSAQTHGIKPLGIKLYADASLHITKALFIETCYSLDIRDNKIK